MAGGGEFERDFRALVLGEARFLVEVVDLRREVVVDGGNWVSGASGDALGLIDDRLELGEARCLVAEARPLPFRVVEAPKKPEAALGDDDPRRSATLPREASRGFFFVRGLGEGSAVAIGEGAVDSRRGGVGLGRARRREGGEGRCGVEAGSGG